MTSLKHVKQALLVCSLGATLLASIARAESAPGSIRVQGGGIALFDESFNFDSDPDRDGSAFSFNVVIGADGAFRGNLLYVMAGRTDLDGAGPQVMQCPVSDAQVNPDGSVTLSSEGVLQTWKGGFLPAKLALTVTAGGAGVGTIQAKFTIPAYGLYDPGVDFAVQTLVSGQIKIR
jgi:hypothetical protein